jgi:hypothetical protein
MSAWVGLEKSDMPDGEDPMYDHPFFIKGMVWANNKLLEKNAAQRQPLTEAQQQRDGINSPNRGSLGGVHD